MSVFRFPWHDPAMRPKPRPKRVDAGPKVKLRWVLVGLLNCRPEICAATKSEARALFKKFLGWSRLPVGAEVIPIP